MSESKPLIGRICFKCKTWKPKKEMTPNLTLEGGMGSYCLNCDRDRSLAKYAARKALGLCRQCEKPISKGITCPECKARRNAATKIRESALLAVEKCVYCKSPVEEAGSICVTCKDKRSKSAAQRYADRVSRGVCVQCQLPIAEGSVYCAEHQGKHNAHNRRLMKRLKENGQCMFCGESRGEEGSDCLCYPCLVNNNMRDGIAKAIASSGGSKAGIAWLSTVDSSFSEYMTHFSKWRGIQGILPSEKVAIHHINPRVESAWEVIGDAEWKKLWSPSNLLPLKKDHHVKIHRGESADIHPKVISYIIKMRERADA